jgi:hypothetical protein
MTLTQNRPASSFVRTLTVEQQPYLLFCEQQPGGNSYLVTCRNNPDIPPMKFLCSDGCHWQLAGRLPETFRSLYNRLAEMLMEHSMEVMA